MATGAEAARAHKRGVAQGGFTLVELMVVLTVMGLLATAVILTLPESKMSLSQESARFAARLLRAREESLLVNRQVRVSVTAADYRFDRREGHAWRALESVPFGTTAWVEGTRVSGRDDETVVVFEPTGQASGAEFTLGRGGAGYVVSVDVAGNVTVHAAQAL